MEKELAIELIKKSAKEIDVFDVITFGEMLVGKRLQGYDIQGKDLSNDLKYDLYRLTDATDKDDVVEWLRVVKGCVDGLLGLDKADAFQPKPVRYRNDKGHYCSRNKYYNPDFIYQARFDGRLYKTKLFIPEFIQEFVKVSLSYPTYVYVEFAHIKKCISCGGVTKQDNMTTDQQIALWRLKNKWDRDVLNLDPRVCECECNHVMINNKDKYPDYHTALVCEKCGYERNYQFNPSM